MRAALALPAAVVLGLIAAANFDPFSVPFTMVLSAAGVMWLARRLHNSSWWLVLGCGVLYGLAFMGVLIRWMTAVSPGAYIGLVIGEAVLFGIVMVAMRSVMALRAWPLWATAVFVTGEWARSNYPFTGFSWGRIGYTAIDTPLESFARLLGTTGMSVVMTLLAVAVLLVVETGRRLRHRVQGVVLAVALVAIGVALPVGLAGGPGDETRQVALIQGNTPGAFLQWPPGEILQLHLDETERLVEAVETGQSPRPDMVLWPENSTDRDPINRPGDRERITDLSARLGAPILVGGIFDGPTPTTSYNAGVVWDESGPGQRYVKRRLVTYGEYVPFRDTLGSLVPQVDREIPRDMISGDEPGVMEIGGTRIGDTICYDIAYDEVVRDLVSGGAQMIVVQTSNAAFTGTAQPEQQWDISRLRAIESGRWVVVPSTNGITGMIDAHGDVVQRAPGQVATTVEQEVPLASGRTPGVVAGASIQYAVVALGVLGWGLGIRQSRRGKTS
ncbi:apolipoprotein N-acyltransferase [Aeromicrobium sp. CF3.5]|uniref:apolipoprotein N-acyltransferase n=1 Tax=Aeromicrobium sp. CF3.5 TaxID=3373078 RepID=UPI003EE513AF